MKGLQKFLLGLIGLLATGLAANGYAQATVEYIHTDALGTPVAITDASGNVIERSDYEPYGKLINRPLTDGPGFTGHVQDAATDLIYMQQRYYDPIIGRFLSTDPVTAYSIPGANFNRYWYAENNPYLVVDMDGRQAARRTNIGSLCDAVHPCEGGSFRDSGSSNENSQDGWLSPGSLLGQMLSPPKEGEGFFDWFSRTQCSGDCSGGLDEILAALPGEGRVYAGGLGLVVKLESITAKFNPARLHIFRAAEGHVAPITAASRARFAKLFELVGSNPKNLRPDAVKAGIITQDAARAGVQAYTQTMRNGQQVWVTVRNGEIMNAGVNAAGATR